MATCHTHQANNNNNNNRSNNNKRNNKNCVFKFKIKSRRASKKAKAAVRSTQLRSTQLGSDLGLKTDHKAATEARKFFLVIVCCCYCCWLLLLPATCGRLVIKYSILFENKCSPIPASTVGHLSDNFHTTFSDF